MKRSRAIGLAAGFALLPHAARADETLKPEDRGAVVQLVAEAVQAPQTIGFTIAVARGGSIVYEAARGKRNLDPESPATVDTWYAIGSVTKQFTAALVMQLVEARRLSLDDRLAGMLPAFPHAGEITFRQLLNHTSGLAEYTEDLRASGLMDKPDVQPQALVALIEDKPLDFSPGTQWEYCNSNYLALGLTIEHLYTMPYAQVVRERIIEPLRIKVNPGPPASGAIARGYTEGEPPKPMTNPDVTWGYAAGELYATVSGLLAWNRALFGNRVVSAESLVQMTTQAKLANGKTVDYGFGLSVVTVHGHRVISHNGGVPGGFAAQNFVFPDDHLSIVTLANTLDFNLALPATKIADVFLPGAEEALQSAAQERVAELDDPAVRSRAREWLDRIEKGSWDKAQLTPQMLAGLTPEAVKPAQDAIKAAGAIKSLHLIGFALRGGYRIFVYSVTGAASSYVFTFALDEHGKVAGLFVKP